MALKNKQTKKKDETTEIIHSKEKEKKRMKKEEWCLRDLWDIIKHTTVHIMKVPEGETRGRRKRYLRKNGPGVTNVAQRVKKPT